MHFNYMASCGKILELKMYFKPSNFRRIQIFGAPLEVIENLWLDLTLLLINMFSPLANYCFSGLSKHFNFSS